ncbi:MAG: chitinase, partial [Lachnospiraceae bacterium]|nr:chitinase [Lachnospiraceae bacterium]
YDLGEQGLITDYVIVMGYDEHWAGSEAGSVASIDFVERGISSAIEAGVPAAKLINGVPFYTRIWRTEGVETNSEAVGMDTTQEWLANRGITPTWDDVCCQYYASYQDGTAFFEVWVEDAQSLETKLSVMDNYGVAGVAAWKLGLESSDVWAIIEAYMN